jgi:hypothetical protein
MVAKMDKILGKRSCGLIFLLSIHFFAYTGLRMNINTIDGITTDSVVVGQPFIVELVIDGVKGSVQTPTIDGMEKYTSRRTGMYMSTINGVSTTKYTYHVIIDQPGEYMIGPARLQHQKQEMMSEPLMITVGYDNNSKATTHSKKKNNESSTMLRLSVDHDHVVVGQKIKAALRFYYQDSALTLSHIGQPVIAGFDCDPISKPLGGTTTIDKIHYRYAEWTYDLYPQKKGELIIPAYSAEYELPAKDRAFGGFFMFMGALSDRKVIYSNAVKISVDELPPLKEMVDGIGYFESFNASILPAIAKEGEGMVFTLEIAGDGNMKNLQIKDPVMPPSFKYYHSNVLLVPESTHNGLTKKRFEFILQPTKAGDWEIPAQKFIYFDVQKQDYQVLRTSPLSVTIQPSLVTQYVADNNPEDNSKDVSITSRGDDFVPLLNTLGPWYSVSGSKPLSLSLFFILLLLPLIFMIRTKMGHYAQSCFHYYFSKAKINIYRRARKKINQCARIGDQKQLHSIFVDFFTHISSSPTKMSSTDIKDYLKRRGVSNHEITEWDLFCDKLVQAAYAHYTSENVYELCRMSIQWLDRLKKYL